ncbi:7,8-didemethyl-8-hydroxy-5-deazariboflavin synthase subunit 1 [Candidatus Nitrosotalea sp. TS]|uniref:7,8-didemethyl-8-hydroxy-5-deazariboflavin synthase CofG n=1 Tax=Candidatus Nitrosotalea sp. TS TaxID=2341020 RepID=UPI001ECEE62A|nr:7,8-didemethyl-8-hydroxy-5-deazariboflavin synthase CofG [Candidatus Nitrosotalea sp. TS]NHI03759.1 7,8-didemethyl-8-hydroxy-5-deazariboflavin synthase subunit 1 [Candidatus Nitrosotalea sp. TS]
MSKIVLNSELLNKVFEGKEITSTDAYQIYQESENNPFEIYKASQILRNKNKRRIVTYSRKVFFNLINLCRDTCSYCTYKSEPGESKTSMMSKQDISSLASVGSKHKCTEALFVTGERPEQKYDEARLWLKENGFTSTAEYLVHASEIALNAGLFPHTNAGNLTKSEMSQLKKTNPSLGVMLENSSERLGEKGMPHEFAPSKNPRARIHVLENAGELSIPMTTGLLIGIGESPFEIIDSIFAIKSIHQKYGHIQEIILQNFQPKQDTAMRDVSGPEERYFKTMVALTRLIMPEMNIQIPPNLSPNSYPDFLQTGINDWGGDISNNS